MFLWALVSSSFGLAHILFGNIRSLGRIIQNGELDSYLLQPKDILLNVLASRTIVSAWGDFLYGFIVMLLVPGIGLARLALFALLIIPGAVIFAATFAAAESLTFFMGNSQAVSSALTEFILSFSLYPETIFDRGMRWVFYTLVPSGFIAFLPLSVYKGMSWPILPLLYLVALAYAAASYFFFQLGLRRYESGNQVGMALTSAFERVIESGIASGELKSVKPGPMAFALFSLVEAYILQNSLFGGLACDEALEAARALLEGLKTNPTKA